jgi:uncharacterized protein (TIGR02246 family)
MQTDEEQIRALVATWMSATKSGDVDTILGLMTDDVVFLIPGRPPMRKEEFATQARAQAQDGAASIDGVSEIQEVSVSGELAFAWAKLHITVSPSGAAPMERAGHTLTVFRKQDGQWRLARDANLLAPAAQR